MPSGGRIDFTVGLKTDKSSVNELNKVLQSLQDSLTLKQSKNGIKQNLQQASKAAKELQGILSGSWNEKLNQLNLSKFNDSVTKSYGSVSALRDKLVQSGPQGAQAFMKISSQVLNTNTQLKESSHLLDDFADTFSKTVKYGIASSVFNNIKNSLQQAFYFAKDLDLSLTNIRIVTGDSADEMERFSKLANQSAESLGRSTLDYTKAALTFYQQGLGADEVQARTEATLMAQNITGAGTQMADYLTAVWNGFQATAENATQYVDKLAAVADSSASDMSQLAIAMSKVASTANSMGVDIDQLNAQIATVVATTRQAPESVGTAFKTIYARINDIKAGTDQAEVSLGNYSGKMAALGFNVFDTSGKLRDTGQVMEQIGNRWQSLTRQQQIYLAQTMAGQRQYNNLIALFDNWTQYSEMLNVSLNAQGTLHEKNGRYMESVKAHMEQLNAETERTYQILSDTGAINNITDTIKEALSLFNDFIEGLGGGVSTLAYFGSVLSGIFSKQLAQGFSSAKIQISQFFADLTGKTNKIKEDWLNASTLLYNGQNGGVTNTQSIGFQAQTQAAKEFLTVSKGLTAEEQKQAMQLQKKIGLNAQLIADLQQQDREAKNLTNEEQKIFDLYQKDKYTIEEVLDTEQRRVQSLRTARTVFAQVAAIQMDGAQKTQVQAAAVQAIQKNARSLKQAFQAVGQTEEQAEETIKKMVADINSGATLIDAWPKKIEEIKNKYELSAQELEVIESLHRKINTDVSKELNAAKENSQEYENQKNTLITIAKQRINTQNIVKGLSSIGQILSSVTGAVKVFGDEASTGAEKANAAFSLTESTIMSIGTAFGPVGMAVATLSNGLLSLIKEITPLGDWLENFFSSTEEKIEKINNLQKEMLDSTKEYKQARSEIEGIREEYEKLSQKSSSFTEEEQERYNQIASIFEKYNADVIVGYDQQGNAIIEKNNAIDDTLDKLDSEYDKLLRNKAAQQNLSDLDLPYKEAKQQIEDLQDSLENIGESANFNILDEIVNQLEQGGHDKIAPKMRDAIYGAMQQLKTMETPEGKKSVLDNLYTTMFGKEGLTKRLAHFEGQQQILDEKLASFRQALRNIKQIPSLLQAANADLENAAPIQVDTFLNQLQVTSEYQALREALGDQWLTFGQSAIDTIIVNYARGLKRSDDKTDFSDFLDEGEEYLGDLLNILDTENLNKAIQKKEKDLEKQTNITLQRYSQIIVETVNKFLKDSGGEKILETGTDDQKNLLTELINGIFGLDISDGKYITDIEKQVDQVVNYTRGQINRLLDGESLSLEESEDFKNYLMQLSEDEFYALKAQIEDLEFQGVYTFDTLISKLKQVQVEAELAQTSLDWSDQTKLVDSLKEKDISKVTGGLDFLKTLEKKNPQLLKLAADEGGRYGEAYIEEYKRIIREEKAQELEAAKQDYQDLLASAEGLTQGTKEYQNIQIQLADALQKVIQTETQLAQITDDSNDQLKTQLELLKEQHDLQKQTQTNAVSAYDKMKSGEDLSDDQSHTLAVLEYENPELAQLTRGSEEYLNLLKEIIQTKQQEFQLTKEQELAEIRREQRALKVQLRYQEDAQKRIELQQQIKALEIEQIALQQQSIDTIEEKYTTLQTFMQGFSEFQDKMAEGITSREDLIEVTEYLDALEKKYPQLTKDVEILRQSWMAGTRVYTQALQNVQEALSDLQVEQAFEAVEEAVDRLDDIKITVDVDAEQFESWKDDVEDFFQKDRNLSISIDNALNQEFEEVQAHIQEIYDAASKIGENFIVAAEDIGQVTAVFPQITQGMQDLDDGSYQLSANMVQYAMAAAQQDVNASSQAMLEKIKTQADYHYAKAESYARIKELAQELAGDEISAASEKNVKIEQIDKEFSKIEEQNKSKVVIKNAEGDEKITESTGKMADTGADAVSNMAVVMSQSFRDFAVSASNNIAKVDQSMKQLTSGSGVTAKEFQSLQTGPTSNIGNIVAQGLSQIRKNFSGVDIDDFSSSSAQKWTSEQWADFAGQAAAREQQQRSAGDAAMAKYYELLGKNNKTLQGIGNIARGQGINGKTPEKDKTTKQSTPRDTTTKEATIQDPEHLDFLEEQIDAFHDINIQLDKIARKFNKVNQEQQKLTGKPLLKNLQKQLNLLNDQINAYKQKRDIAQNEANILKKQLESEGVSFDKRGQISNYAYILRSKENAVNEYINYYNSLTKEEQEYIKDSVEQAKQDFEDFKDRIADYEKLINETIPDIIDSIDDSVQKKLQIKFSKFRLAVDAKIDLAQLSRDYTKFLKTVKYQIRSDDILGNTKFLLKELKSYEKKPIYNSIDGQITQIYKVIEQINKMSGSNKNASEIFGNDKQGAIEYLTQLKDNLEQDLNDIFEKVQEIRSLFLDSIQQVAEGYQKRQSYYDHLLDNLEHEAKVVDLIFGDTAYEKMDTLYSKQAEYQIQNLKDLQGQQQNWKTLLDDARRRQSVLDSESNTWKQVQEEIDLYEKNWMESTQKLNSTLESTLQTIIDKYENVIRKTFSEIDFNLSNGRGMQLVGQEWELIQKRADQYLDTINSIYGIEKLQSRYTDALSDNRSVKAQKELKSLQQAQLSMLQQKDKLSEWDLKRANKQLDIELKRLALQESRSNKTKLRLRRDSQGNYSYQYTADEDDSNQRLQELKDLQNQLYNLTKQEYTTNISNFYRDYQDYMNKAQQIAIRNRNDEVRMKQQLEELNRQYLDILNSDMDQANETRVQLAKEAFASITDGSGKYSDGSGYSYRKVFDKDGLISSYYSKDEKNVEAWMQNNYDTIESKLKALDTGPYADNMKAFEKMVGDQDESGQGMVPIWNSGIQKMIDKITGPEGGEGGFQAVINELMENIHEGIVQYETDLKSASESSGTYWEAIGTGIGGVYTATEKLRESNQKLLTSYQNVFNAMKNIWINQLQDFTKEYSTAIQAVSDIYGILQKNDRQTIRASANSVDNDIGIPDLIYDPGPANVVDIGDLTNNGLEVHPVGYNDKEVWPSDTWFTPSGNGGTDVHVPDTKENRKRLKEGRYPSTKSRIYLGNKLFRDAIASYDTGGYTGIWGNEEKIGFLHEKELILNAEDTKNILEAVNMIRDISGLFNFNLPNFNTALDGAFNQTLDQNVHITATFPNVNSSREIEMALNNLTNRASQYIYSNRR